jgi:hypothetical protein
MTEVPLEDGHDLVGGTSATPSSAMWSSVAARMCSRRCGSVCPVSFSGHDGSAFQPGGSPITIGRAASALSLRGSGSTRWAGVKMDVGPDLAVRIHGDPGDVRRGRVVNERVPTVLIVGRGM